ncbi:MAG: thiamine phosphate synthase [Bdellovibrionales bacterium]|nr:thiamine phosphate synthase [Bdellovibrionales bacterium]
MELIVLSTPGNWNGLPTDDEVAKVNELFESGLQHFHLRKPMYSVSELRRWLSAVEPRYLGRVSIHSFHDLVLHFPVGGIHTSERQRRASLQSRQQDAFLLEQSPHLRLSSSFHDLSDLRFAPKIYDYTFLSPIFDSISQPHYKACFSSEELKTTVQNSKNKVIALGGVSAERIKDVADLGFDGAGLLGAIWQSSDPVVAFKECQSAAEEFPAAASYEVDESIRLQGLAAV